MTKPGAKLKLGQPAFIEVKDGKKADESYARSILKVTVTQIRKGSNKDFAKLNNASEFKGSTPFYIESTNQIVFFEGNRYDTPDVILAPIGTGRIGDVLIFMGSLGGCQSTTYDTENGMVGAVRKPCDIGAGVDGGIVTGAKYSGGSDTSSDYYKSPITWGPGE